jgi:cysteinyl-tRNA synthetase, unknown class
MVTIIMTRALLFLLSFVCINPSHAIDPRLADVNDYTYLLQVGDTTMESIAATNFDLIVMDYSREGGGDTELTTSNIATIKDSGKVALAYLSIGEAEDYRYYWKQEWKQSPPSWLGKVDPNWPGNFYVRYWEPGWQSILFGTTSGINKAYLDRIIDQGFDGIYLDIIDAYYYWSTSRGKNERTRLQARTDMINLVIALRNYARVTRGKTDFLVFPQNAQEIIYDENENIDAIGQQYLDAIDGIGNEDVWYNGTKKQSNKNRAYVLTLLDIYKTNGAGRLILDVEYLLTSSTPPANKANVKRYNDFKQRALDAGIVSYASDKSRDLDSIITINAGTKFQHNQPLAEP